jgi:hypothetical protein
MGIGSEASNTRRLLRNFANVLLSRPHAPLHRSATLTTAASHRRAAIHQHSAAYHLLHSRQHAPLARRDTPVIAKQSKPDHRITPLSSHTALHTLHSGQCCIADNTHHCADAWHLPSENTPMRISSSEGKRRLYVIVLRGVSPVHRAESEFF